MTISPNSLETCAARIATTFMRCDLQMDRSSVWRLHCEVEPSNSCISPSLPRSAKRTQLRLTRLSRELLTQFRQANSSVLNQPQGEGMAIFITCARVRRHWKILRLHLAP